MPLERTSVDWKHWWIHKRIEKNHLIISIFYFICLKLKEKQRNNELRKYEWEIEAACLCLGQWFNWKGRLVMILLLILGVRSEQRSGETEHGSSQVSIGTHHLYCLFVWRPCKVHLSPFFPLCLLWPNHELLSLWQ